MDPHINPSTGVWDDNYYANLNKGSGGGGSGYNYDPAVYDNLLKTLPKATDYATSLNANENAALGDYFGYLNSQETPLNFFTKISEAQGIPEMRKTQSTLQGQIYDLEDTLRRIEPNVGETTRESLVTEGQRQGMVTEKQKPLIEDLGWLGQSLGRVSSAISDATSQAMNLTGLQQQGVQRFVDAYKTKLDVAMQQGSRALQAFISDTDRVLDVTLAKISRKEKVDDMEAAQAFELVKMQEQAKLNMQAESAKTSTEVVEAGGRKLLIDKNTGKTIADLGSSSSAGGGGADISKYLTPQSVNTAQPNYDVNLYNYLFGDMDLSTKSGASAYLK